MTVSVISANEVVCVKAVVGDMALVEYPDREPVKTHGNGWNRKATGTIPAWEWVPTVLVADFV